MKTTLLPPSMSLCSPACGIELSVTSKEKIAHHFSYLEKSGWEFYRNGTVRAINASAEAKKTLPGFRTEPASYHKRAEAESQAENSHLKTEK